MAVLHWREVSAHQYLVLQARVTEFSCRAPEIHEDVIGVGVWHLEAHVAEGGNGERANVGILFPLPLDQFIILRRCECSHGSEHSHIPHAPGVPHGCQGLLLPEREPDSQARNAMCFGERTGNEYIFELMD